MDGHLRRIERQAGVPGLAESLARLAPTDLQSLLLHVFREQAARRDPRTLLEHYERDASVAAGRSVHALEALAFEAAAGFEPVALAPVSPLGLNGVLGRIDQNNVASTIRTTEVLADPTAALALEAAVRRRANPGQTVRLCAACRVLRLQPLPPGPGFTQHFALFALITAGRAQPSHGFEIDALRVHVAVYLRRFEALGISGHQVLLTAAPPFGFVDGGRTDWTQRLLSNRKERLFTSGIGLNLLSVRVL